MPLDLKNRLAFIHIPKTAGSSIEAALGLKKGENFFIGRSNSAKFEVHMQHLYLNELEEAVNLENFKVFTVIRNPFDRLVSTYHYHKAEKGYQGNNFEVFVRYALNKEDRRSFFDGHLELQINYIESHKGYHCEIFRFEELCNVSTWLGAQLNRAVELPHYRKSERLADYRAYYKSAELVDVVTAFYAEDLQRFGYTFN